MRKETKEPMNKKLKREIERKHYKKQNWTVKSIASKLVGSRFMKFENL